MPDTVSFFMVNAFIAMWFRKYITSSLTLDFGSNINLPFWNNLVYKDVDWFKKKKWLRNWGRKRRSRKTWAETREGGAGNDWALGAWACGRAPAPLCAFLAHGPPPLWSHTPRSPPSSQPWWALHFPEHAGLLYPLAFACALPTLQMAQVISKIFCRTVSHLYFLHSKF